MSKKLYLQAAIISLLIGIRAQTSKGEIVGLVETTYDDANWVIVASNLILRENTCTPSNWYEKVFNPCSGQTYNRYWRLEPDGQSGHAFPMGSDYEPPFGIGKGSFDSFYVRDGYGFQIYDNENYPSNPNDLNPYGPYMVGPQYVSLTYWQYQAVFEPGTFFVSGNNGDLRLYSIIIYANPLSLDKTAAIENGYDCVSPVDENKDQITYTINYTNPSEGQPYYIGTINDATITDYLAKEEVFGWASGPNSTYNPGSRSVRWEIGNLEPGQSGSVTLGVTVNELAEPVGIIRNSCTIGPNSLFFAVADTNVCCWNPGVIYVDDTADDTGLNNGMSWENAYLNLQSALKRASECFCDEIKVAKGEYIPSVPSANPTFSLVDGVKMYGGYPSGGGLRDWLKNETILKKGQVFTNYVAKAIGVGSGTVIDGFTIRDADHSGIYCSDCYESYPVVSHVQMIWNDYCGLYCDASSPTIENCLVHHKQTWGGIYCVGGASAPLIRNNTIVNNGGYGIRGSGNPSVINCIIWGNTGTQVYGVTPTYSCIQGWSSGGTNIGSNPLFVHADSNDYHLRSNSPCIDWGDPSYEPEVNETDIDGQIRRMDGNGDGNFIVDMGADEYCHSPADFDDSCDVDLLDFSILASAWGSEFGNINYNEKCDLEDDNVIDTKDLDLFCDEWLGKMCRDEHVISMEGEGDSLFGGEGMEFSQETFGLEGTETSYESEPAPAPEMDPNVIEEMLEWLDEMWQSGVFKEVMTEEEYLEFRKLVLESGGY